MVIKEIENGSDIDVNPESYCLLLNQYKNIFTFLEVIYQELYLYETQILILKVRG
ncbi:hypothetical protein [Spiroplasma endosymbiont of Panorpa germanica]|uniref:hypothetical protein n=1 Tax=Spiroplasma endosymbiont of Panorpa germanica TaxID=3066314 RepID=UPI0030D26266